MAVELIDSHCHLFYDYLPKTADDLVREAGEVGVSTMITVATDKDSFAKVKETSEKYANVYHTIGIHPHDSGSLSDEDLELIRAAGKHPKCRAIGEIGLDYHYDHSDRAVQRQRLDQQLAIALELGLPVVIHGREAEDDLLLSLTAFARALPAGKVPGVLHCFTGTLPFAQACIELGFYVSFSGILTFKNAEDLRVTAAALPLDRLLVETDSPYLAPIPYRGKKCEPSMVKLTAQKLAETRGISFEDVAAATTVNSRRVFGL